MVVLEDDNHFLFCPMLQKESSVLYVSCIADAEDFILKSNPMKIKFLLSKANDKEFWGVGNHKLREKKKYSLHAQLE